VVTEGALQGLTVCVKGFTCAPDLISLDLKTKPEEPAAFKYADFIREKDKRWDTEMKTCRSKPKRRVGPKSATCAMVSAW